MTPAELLQTIATFTTLYMVGFFLATFFFLAIGSSARDLPLECFILGVLWPLALPAVILDRAYRRVKHSSDNGGKNT